MTPQGRAPRLPPSTAAAGTQQPRCARCVATRCSDLLAPTVVHGQVQRLVSEREDSQSQNDSLRVRLKESQRAAADSLKQGEAAAGLRNHNRQLQQSLSKLEAHLGPGSAGLADTIAALELQVAALQAAAPGTAPARPGLAGVRSSLFENSLFEDGDAAAAGDGGQALESRELQRQLAAEQGRTAALTRQVRARPRLLAWWGPRSLSLTVHRLWAQGCPVLPPGCLGCGLHRKHEVGRLCSDGIKLCNRSGPAGVCKAHPGALCR